VAETGLDVRANVPLAPLTTLELGGSARFLVDAAKQDDIVEALRWAEREQVPVAVLGAGSNVVVSDGGFPGVVVRVGLRGIELRRDGDTGYLEVAAGEPWDDLVEWAVAEDLAGFECLSGIPGTVGATPIQNVGAYGQEVSEVIDEVLVLDRVTWIQRRWDRCQCEFAYRSSRFRTEPDRYVVLAVRFALRHGGQPTVRYPELESALGSTGTAPSLAAIRATVLELRRAKSMVVDPEDANRRSVGSFFVNPIITRSRYEQLVRSDDGRGMPCYPVGAGVKLAAAWLIESCGFPRGFRRGRVGLSSRHALAIVHHGGGCTDDLVRLAREIRTAVFERFGIELEPEPRFLGFSETDPTRRSASS
jgi:UDP-N-acetylmuramate dehydrogenase